MGTLSWNILVGFAVSIINVAAIVVILKLRKEKVSEKSLNIFFGFMALVDVLLLSILALAPR